MEAQQEINNPPQIEGETTKDKASDQLQELGSNKSNTNDLEREDEEVKNQLIKQQEESKKEILQKLKETLVRITKQKEEQETKKDQKELKTNDFLENLEKLPSFQDIRKGNGYFIINNFNGNIPDSVIRIIINKFLNRRFIKKDSTLNSRSKSLERTQGFYKWNYKDLTSHSETKQLTKIPLDKYDYKEATGKSENIPFSFYFDLSSSMSRHSGLLAVLVIELLKKDVKVLIGFNEKVNVQIDKIKYLKNVEEFKETLLKFGEEYYT